MKNVLILAYDFPPYVSVGGMRPTSWFKNMHRHGLYPIIITRQWSNEFRDYRDFISASHSKETIIEKTKEGTIIKTPYKPNLSNRLLLKYGDSRFKFLRKMVTAYYEFAQFVFLVGPKKELYLAAEEYMKDQQVDMILATGEPYVLFKFASQLSSKYNIPWIADYRDTWSQNRAASNYMLKNKWESIFEKKYLANVKLITTASPVFKKNISELLPGKSFRIVSNGFDLESIEAASNIRQGEEKMSIAFVGAVYDWHPMKSFLNSCCQFVKKEGNPEFEINFYGVNQSHFKYDIADLLKMEYPELEQYVTIYPKIPNEELVQKLATNNLFLLFNYYTYMGTKIYDYLGLKRNILLCYSNDDEARELRKKYYNFKEGNFGEIRVQEDLMKQTKSGIIVKNSAHLKDVLAMYYEEFQMKRTIQCNSIGIDDFSRDAQVEKMSDIIFDLLK